MSCSDQDYEYLRALVLAQSANLIAPTRKALFETRLAPVARLAGAQDLEGLVTMLQADRPARLHRAVAEAMTINETSFFRDMWPWEALRQNVIPKLLQQNAGERRLRIWSAASSTGQEAYSLAMLLQEHFPELTRWDVKILGTDISEAVVDSARQGVYRRLEVNRGLPAKMLMRYLVREGESWQMNEKTRALCEFRVANLCDNLTGLPVFDLVLLRNVLLYFLRLSGGRFWGRSTVIRQRRVICCWATPSRRRTRRSGSRPSSMRAAIFTGRWQRRQRRR